MPRSGLFAAFFKEVMDERPVYFPTPYQRLYDVESVSDAESSTVIDMPTPSTTEETVSVTLVDEDEGQQTLSSLKKDFTPYYDEETPNSEQKSRDNDNESQEEPLTSQQKPNRCFWRFHRQCRNSKDGETCCRKFFGRRCRREKRCKAKRIIIFLKLTALLVMVVFLLLKFSRRCHSRRRLSLPSPDIEPEGLYYTYDSAGSSTREIIVEKDTGSIFGRYPLYDLLCLKTITGSIVVHIDPQPADPDFPDKPARVVLESTTGSITVTFSTPDTVPESPTGIDPETVHPLPDHLNVLNSEEDVYNYRNGKPCSKMSSSSSVSSSISSSDNTLLFASSSTLPVRPYELYIKSHTGSIHGYLIYSSYASIETDRGSIDLSLTPIVYSNLPSNTTLITESKVGSQHIRLLEPIFLLSPSSSASSSLYSSSSTSDDLGLPTAQHITTTGSLSVSYPPTWAGSVYASAGGEGEGAQGTGAICLDGQGLKVQKDGQGHGWGRKEPKEDNRDDDGNNDPVWWGSTGKMEVNLTTHQTGSINFFARSEGHW
jgi:hypothetical protein